MRPTDVIEFTVEGDPVPQGSMKAFVPKGWTRAVLTTANPKLKTWRQRVRSAALNAMGFLSPAGKKVPIRIVITFYFQRAATNRDLDKVTAPDIDKLCRGVFDALTGVCYEDDAQITEVHAAKFYGRARVEIKVSEVLPASATLPLAADFQTIPF